MAENFEQQVIEDLAYLKSEVSALKKAVERQNGNVSENRKDIQVLKVAATGITTVKENDDKYAAKWVQRWFMAGIGFIVLAVLAALLLLVVPNAQF